MIYMIIKNIKNNYDLLIKKKESIVDIVFYLVSFNNT